MRRKTNLCASVRHEATGRACGQKVPSHPAENPFAQTAVPIRPGDQEVCLLVFCKLNELRRARSFLLKNNSGATAYPVSRQISRHVIEVMLRGRFFARPANLDDCDPRNRGRG